MHSRNRRYPDYQELTIIAHHEECRKKLLVFLPSRQTFLERAVLIGDLDGDEACFFCPMSNEEYYEGLGCCKHCRDKYSLEETGIILRIFLAANMGLVEDVVHVISRLLVLAA
jgi:hypothetical protein